MHMLKRTCLRPTRLASINLKLVETPRWKLLGATRGMAHLISLSELRLLIQGPSMRLLERVVSKAPGLR